MNVNITSNQFYSGLNRRFDRRCRLLVQCGFRSRIVCEGVAVFTRRHPFRYNHEQNIAASEVMNASHRPQPVSTQKVSRVKGSCRMLSLREGAQMVADNSPSPNDDRSDLSAEELAAADFSIFDLSGIELPEDLRSPDKAFAALERRISAERVQLSLFDTSPEVNRVPTDPADASSFQSLNGGSFMSTDGRFFDGYIWCASDAGCMTGLCFKSDDERAAADWFAPNAYYLKGKTFVVFTKTQPFDVPMRHVIER